LPRKLIPPCILYFVKKRKSIQKEKRIRGGKGKTRTKSYPLDLKIKIFNNKNVPLFWGKHGMGKNKWKSTFTGAFSFVKLLCNPPPWITHSIY